ncbi:hypothetical protein [Sphingosinicella sp. YJ22]|uniref:hypothetical protein n=1 Tax=Sphingosinicella sp. YJ22 TaxID=1104780 RepID=UPI001407F674|nr:hypothetical protein [Sphingosinicella sp. YJ22]
MTTDYGGFGHAVNMNVRFDPLKFIDAERDPKAYYIDIDLLRAGSAIAIVCEFYDVWCNEFYLPADSCTRYQDALEVGRLRFFPDIEEFLRAATARYVVPVEDGWFAEAVVPIYKRYVLGLFAQLAAPQRSA